MSVNTITCKLCNKNKPIEEFYKDKYKASGVKNERCKECIKKIELGEEIVPGQQITKKLPFANVVDMFKNNAYDDRINKVTHYSMYIVAQSKSGKTTFLLHLLDKIEYKYDFIIFLSYNLHDPIYSSILQNPKYLCFDNYTDDLLHDLFILNKETKNKLSFCIVLDDCLGSHTKHGDMLFQLFTRGRNNGMTIIVSSQVAKGLNSDSRSNINYGVFMKLNNPQMIENMVESFIYGLIETPPFLKSKGKKVEYLINYYRNHTNNYNMMIVDFLNNEVFTYKV